MYIPGVSRILTQCIAALRTLLLRQGLLENEVRSSGEIGRGGSESEKEVQEVFRYSYRVFYLVYDIALILLILSVVYWFDGERE